MCTGLSMLNGKFYFGRNLDLDWDFGQQVVITPRKYPFVFTKEPPQNNHFALIGMANVTENYPLYAEAINEKGLGMAGLYFAASGHYPSGAPDAKYQVSPYELIPWVLGQCDTLKKARELLENLALNAIPFSRHMPLTLLHWIISDKTGTLVAEPIQTGFRVYENPVGVLTNEPPFEFHMTNLHNYINLTREYAKNRFSDKIELVSLGTGMGSIGLPGDPSSVSRFVRAAFNKWNGICEKEESSSVSQFFHILDSVSVVSGTLLTRDRQVYFTRYSCCMNGDDGVYYYKTYQNNQITAVHLFNEDLEARTLKTFPLITQEQIRRVN